MEPLQKQMIIDENAPEMPAEKAAGTPAEKTVEKAEKTWAEKADRRGLVDIFRGRGFERILAPGAIDAAVLLPLIKDAETGEYDILFELRSSKIAQGGEVCFPGGRVEPGETPRETALRETMEELLLPEEQICVIAPLFKLTGPGGSEVSCFLGELLNYAGTFDKDETEYVFRLPVKRLLAMDPLICESHYEMRPAKEFPYRLIQGGEQYQWHKIRKTHYFYETEYETIWGMTAELLYHYLEEVRSGAARSRAARTEEDTEL